MYLALEIQQIHQKKNRINMRAKTVTADNLHLKHQKSL
jgi:hypothetical protein